MSQEKPLEGQAARVTGARRGVGNGPNDGDSVAYCTDEFAPPSGCDDAEP